MEIDSTKPIPKGEVVYRKRIFKTDPAEENKKWIEKKDKVIKWIKEKQKNNMRKG